MKRWLVWMEDDSPDGADDGIEVDAFDAEDAGATACEYWDSHAAFVDGYPNEIRCCVREVGGHPEHVVVVVTHDYSINWYGDELPKVDPAP